MNKSTLLLIVTLLGAGTAHAQKTPVAVPGNTVRVWSSATVGQLSEGRLLMWTADTVTLSPVWEPKELAGKPLSVPTSSLVRVDVEHIRTRSEGFNRGLKKGIVFGLFAGVAAGLLLNDLQKDNVIPLAAATAVAGVALYSGYGYLSPGRSWEQVHPRARPLIEEVRP
jgi:hypothetical protein